MLSDLEALVPPIIVCAFFVALVRAILRIQNPQRRAAAKAREQAAEASDPRISRTPMYGATPASSAVPGARPAKRAPGPRDPNRPVSRPATRGAVPKSGVPGSPTAKSIGRPMGVARPAKPALSTGQPVDAVEAAAVEKAAAQAVGTESAVPTLETASAAEKAPGADTGGVSDIESGTGTGTGTAADQTN